VIWLISADTVRYLFNFRFIKRRIAPCVVFSKQCCIDALIVSSLQLTTWLFNNVATMMIFAIPVIFQPELRRALEEFSLDPFKNLFKAVPEYDISVSLMK